MLGSMPLAKLGVHAAATLGVSKVLNDVIRNNVTIVTRLDNMRVWAGVTVIGSMVAKAASDHVNERIDTLTEWYKNRDAEGDDTKEIE